MVFDTDPLTERCEILGAPAVELEIAANRPSAMVAARLSDVDPEGRATRISYGLPNLTRRDGDEEPHPLEPERRYRVRVQLKGLAQSIPPGHRIRLSLSRSYWPLAWPPPQPARLSVYAGASRLVLPMRPPEEADDVTPRPFDPPEGAPRLGTTQLRPGELSWTVSRDLGGYRSTLEIIKDNGTVRYEDIDLDQARRVVERYVSVADDFTSPRGEVEWSMAFSRDGWSVRTVTSTVLTCTRSISEVYAQLDGYEGERRTFSRNRERSIPRDCL